MNDSARIVTDENAADERYRSGLKRDDALRPRIAHRSGRGQHTRANAASPLDGLIGRIQLDRVSDIFDGDQFYIGARHYEQGDLTVFSWTAPIACTFFRGGDHHEHCPHVVQTRTLQRRGGRIVDYVDERGPARATTTPFAQRGMILPAAPRRRSLPGARPGADVPRERPAVPAPRRPAARTPVLPRRTRKPTGTVIRAEQAVRAALAAPRGERLDGVLATIQPDQYHLVTADPAESLIVQGPPGTGKTVVAAHRAAYLTHDRTREEHRRRRVLVVGPTTHYVEHITGVLDELVDDRSAVRATSLDELLLEIRDIPGPIDDGGYTDFHDVEHDLGVLVERAANMLRSAGRLVPGSDHQVGVEAVYSALRANTVGRDAVVDAAEWVAYLAALPPLRAVRTMRRFLPLLAACGAAVRGSRRSFDHVIVDEGQDLTALDWALLRGVGAGASWTVLGDMQQRRSDRSCRTWSHVRDAIEEPSARIETLENGYRTAASIMAFADRLLPAGDRRCRSLQDGGPDPRILRGHASTVARRVTEEAITLLAGHPEGTVAVISLEPESIGRALRRERFVVDGRHPSRFVRASRVVRVLDPQEARGLEFDAVVVVEPGAFPRRFDHHGLLYTSLTRANRELVVVHSTALPTELRTGAQPGSRR